MDTILKNNIEGIILKWSYQVQMVYFLSFEFSIQTDEVLGKDSAEELNKGNNPGPMTEIKFWDAKVGTTRQGWRVLLLLQCTNLESLFEQMKADTTRKMASILNVTDSAYYPCFRWSI